MLRFAFVLVLGAVFLTGCGPRYEALKTVARTAAENVADETLDYAIWVKCRAASAGAIRRRYGKNFQVWAIECLDYIPD